MKKIVNVILILGWVLTGCSGAKSVTKKSWDNIENTLAIIDLTRSGEDLMDAGAQLNNSLEETLLRTNFVVSDDSPSYKLKYKVIRFDKGNRIKRFATIGALSKIGQANLKVQVALFRGKKMVGRWDIESWLNDGLFGGNNRTLFRKASHKIVEHLKGDF